MTTTMEKNILNKSINNLPPNFLLTEQITVQQLIDLVIDSGSDNVGIKIKQELFERGKDNIKIRIEIKKSCKSNIQNIESVLKELDNERNPAETVKQYKHRFLNAISILDRLQLEWQKYDLCFKH